MSSLSVRIGLVLKKMKHRIVESMSSTTADALGLSRAILCNGKTNELNAHLNMLFDRFVFKTD
jgi:hypothetical protein